MYSASSMEEENLGAWLGLGIGGGGGGGGGSCAPRRSHGERRPSVQLDVLFPQDVKEERGCHHEQAVDKKVGKGARRRIKIGDDGWSHGASPSDGGNDGSDGASTRKKLRLTKEQSTLLEDSFRVHNILSHAQKQELARQLNLSPRQVEVWFQNRRARTKLKQTEVDCEFLKRFFESLTDENQRLKHELMELQRSAPAASGSQLYVQFPRAAGMVNVCPSCEKVTVMSGGEMSSKSSSSCS